MLVRAPPPVSSLAPHFENNRKPERDSILQMFQVQGSDFDIFRRHLRVPFLEMWNCLVSGDDMVFHDRHKPEKDLQALGGGPARGQR